MKDNEPEIFQHAYKFIGIKEYIFFRLFDTYVVDTGIASATGLLNINTLPWDKEILRRLELSPDKLSKVVPVEHLQYYKHTQKTDGLLNIADDIPFVIGSSDGALANLGTGSVTRTLYPYHWYKCRRTDSFRAGGY